MTTLNNPSKNIWQDYSAVFADEQILEMSPSNLIDSLKKFFILSPSSQTASQALEIINVAAAFMNETDPDFKHLRDQHVDDNNIVLRFNNTGNELISLLESSKHAAQPEKKVLDHVILLCLHSMNARIHALKISDPRIYQLYTAHPNNLRKLLPG